MAPNIRTSVSVGAGVRLLINVSLHKISSFFPNVFVHLLNFFVLTMTANLETPSRVYLSGKTA